MVIVVVAAIAAVSSLIAWLAYLRFLSKIDPKHYKDVAVPVKAFRSAGISSLAEAIMKALATVKSLGKKSSA